MSSENNHSYRQQHFNDFKKCFEKLAYRQSYHTVFIDFVDFSLLMLNINKAPSDFADLETRWETEKDHHLFAKMFMLLGECSFNFSDALGDIFMEFVSHGRNGQYFTPEPICDMMTAMQGEYKDGMSICDPACGSGRMLLSAARKNRNLNFYAGDNDLLCAKMTALNFLLNTMPGEVAHMDALSLEHHCSWHISKILIGTHYIPVYHKTGPGETSFIKKIIKTQPQARISDVAPFSPEIDFELNKKGQFILF